MKLPASLTIRDMRDVVAQFRVSSDAASIAMDGSAVEQIDTAGLQLLIAFQNAMIDAGTVVGWSACSAPLRAAATELGMLKSLGIPSG